MVDGVGGFEGIRQGVQIAHVGAHQSQPVRQRQLGQRPVNLGRK